MLFGLVRVASSPGGLRVSNRQAFSLRRDISQSACSISDHDSNKHWSFRSLLIFNRD
ncbi:Hypothetical protein PMT_2702 [Prochlorococcus marinus str. MIT 9313]|uniref:Uncharacterized protein n=1 Tax=Prochlorococcus marinus (strain MIT 9313) TaxID=74547 RepID=B9ES86_PROMM|nr:Hypothetical protein PMT_2702 [Prochlorococcus marinus str. MIT 9313]